MADHRDDIDADFLAVYGIDLDRTRVPAKRFLALASRLPLYDGAMAAAVATEQQPAPPAHDPDAPQEVPVDAMNLMIPGLIERAEV